MPLTLITMLYLVFLLLVSLFFSLENARHMVASRAAVLIFTPQVEPFLAWIGSTTETYTHSVQYLTPLNL